MALIPWKNKTDRSPDGGLSSMTEFRTEMNRLFDTFFREPLGSIGESFSSLGRWAPTLDVAENDRTVIVRAELPGVDPKDLDITVTGDRLTISGEKKETSERKEKDYFHRESRYGSFSRTVELPAGIDPQQVSADYDNGVLTITLQKSPGAVAKKVPVKTK
ncbi:MAG: Hsp20/alpha crystallin family protein [Pirellulales bacterium]|nr:Hsp20/alpha crystallin family protein [Pirellulales bacterium]